MPVLTLPNGNIITQSLAIARYVGKLSGLYPIDPIKALYVDEILDTVNEVFDNIPPTSDPEQMKQYMVGKLTTCYSYLAEKLKTGPFFLGARYSIADFYFYNAVQTFRAGYVYYDCIPTDFDSTWPSIDRWVNSLEADPAFAPHKFTLSIRSS